MSDSKSKFVQIGFPQHLQPSTPSVFTLEITSHCQHHCVGCGNVFEHDGDEMDAKAWAAILKRLQPYADRLRITGGEPTLHRQFQSIIALVDDLGVDYALFTNGDWKNPHAVVEILRDCDNLSSILVSLHGVDAESYQLFTQVDAFSTVKDNIQLAVDAGLRVTTNTLLLRTTYQNIPRIVDLSTSLGSSMVSFGRYYGEPLPSHFSLTNIELKTALIQIAEIRSQNPRVVLSNCVPVCFLPEVDFGERGCTSGLTHCTIGPLGEVRPCTHTALVLGNIWQTDIETLWQSPDLDTWRRRIPPSCLNCAALSLCRGGCRATAEQLGLSSDPLMRGPLSELERLPVVRMHPHAYPKLIPRVNLVKLSDGYALQGMGHYIPLSWNSGPILETLDGSLMVEEIESRFGMAAVHLVGSLVRRHLVELV